MHTATIPVRSREWFEDHLYAFFTKYFGRAAYDAEFLDSPKPNQYVFDLPDMNKRVILTCNDDASILKEERDYNGKVELNRIARKAEICARQGGNYGNYEDFFNTPEGIGHPGITDITCYAPGYERAGNGEFKILLRETK